METAKIKPLVETEQLNNVETKPKKKRIWEIDFIRGFCVLLMVFDHIIFDIWIFGDAWNNAGMFDFGYFYWYHEIRVAIRLTVVFLFFFISGISTSFSRSNLYRALKVLIFAYLVTFFTSFVEIDIRFGVLHALGYSMLIYALLDLIDKTIWSKLAIGAILVILGILIAANSADFLNLPQWLNNVLGLPEKGFSADDYVPMLPWTGIFLIGSVFGRLFYKQRKSLLSKLETKFTEPIEFLGRHALIIYPLHQLIIFGTFCLVSIILKYPLPF